MIVYGAPGTECFAEMHAAVTSALAAEALHEFTYLLRPTLLPGCSRGDGASDLAGGVGARACLSAGTASPPNLSGFGVDLVVKDTEYSQVCSDTCHSPLSIRDAGSIPEGLCRSVTCAQLWPLLVFACVWRADRAEMQPSS